MKKLVLVSVLFSFNASALILSPSIPQNPEISDASPVLMGDDVMITKTGKPALVKVRFGNPLTRYNVHITYRKFSEKSKNWQDFSIKEEAGAYHDSFVTIPSGASWTQLTLIDRVTNKQLYKANLCTSKLNYLTSEGDKEYAELYADNSYGLLSYRWLNSNEMTENIQMKNQSDITVVNCWTRGQVHN